MQGTELKNFKRSILPRHQIKIIWACLHVLLSFVLEKNTQDVRVRGFAPSEARMQIALPRVLLEGTRQAADPATRGKIPSRIFKHTRIK
jgi:hypothetical protein